MQLARPALEPAQPRGREGIHLFALRVQGVLRLRLGEGNNLLPKLTRHGLGFAGVARIGVGVRAERLPPYLLPDVALVAQYAGPEIVKHEFAESLHLDKTLASPDRKS